VIKISLLYIVRSKAVDRRKKKMSDVHGEYVEKCLILHLDRALVLSIEDYHNIHVQKQANTSWAAHINMAQSYSRPAIPRDGAITPKIIDKELVSTDDLFKTSVFLTVIVCGTV